MRLMIFAFLVLTCITCIAEDFPSGTWEGYNKMGSTYQEFILDIDTNGDGYYGFTPDVRYANAICFTISRNILIKTYGYFQKHNKLNGIDFTLLLIPSIDGTVEAISIVKEFEKKTSIVQSFSLTPVHKTTRNVRTVDLCKGYLKNQK